MEQAFFLDEAIAARYDESASDEHELALVAATVDVLAELAADGSGTALELGIGTGRIALPLAARGIAVSGIDLSEPMLRQLRAKPGADAIDVTVGSFRTASLGRQYRLVFGVFNVFTTFTTQEEQIDAVRNAADHVEAGGFLVAECWVPDLQRLPPGDRFRAFDVSATHLAFDEFEVAQQRCTSHHYLLEGGALVAHGESHHRWLWPSELDLMARIAGLTLHERWATWAKESFNSRSRNCISVYRRSA